MSIYIGNLSYEVNKEDLSEVFTEYGTVKRVHIPTDRETLTKPDLVRINGSFSGSHNRF